MEYFYGMTLLDFLHLTKLLISRATKNSIADCDLKKRA